MMNSKICTSIEQSQRLIELGIDIKTADMYWWYWYSEKRYYVGAMDDDDFNEKSDIPAWSLSALLELMRGVLLRTPNPLESSYCCHNNEEETYADDPIDAAFEMVCRLKENGKI